MISEDLAGKSIFSVMVTIGGLGMLPLLNGLDRVFGVIIEAPILTLVLTCCMTQILAIWEMYLSRDTGYRLRCLTVSLKQLYCDFSYDFPIRDVLFVSYFYHRKVIGRS